jgi:hypothetical protein
MVMDMDMGFTLSIITLVKVALESWINCRGALSFASPSVGCVREIGTRG